jgi:hypothetical protein
MGKKTPKSQRGIWSHKDAEVKVLDFSYDSTILAQLVVDAWASTPLKNKLLDHTNQNAVQQELANRGIFLNHPVVLTEAEYNDGWQQEDDNEVVLVLPNDGRKIAASGGFTLIETAKLLMAVTPNGI